MCGQSDTDGLVIYAPMLGSYLGAVGGWPILSLLSAFIWHCKRGNITTLVHIPGFTPKPMKNCLWHESNFEEWFLAVAFYPRAAGKGILTLVPTRTHSSLLLFDIEYVTWANPHSEVMVYPTKPCRGYSPPDMTLPPEILAIPSKKPSGIN